MLNTLQLEKWKSRHTRRHHWSEQSRPRFFYSLTSYLSCLHWLWSLDLLPPVFIPRPPKTCMALSCKSLLVTVRLANKKTLRYHKLRSCLHIVFYLFTKTDNWVLVCSIAWTIEYFSWYIQTIVSVVVSFKLC